MLWKEDEVEALSQRYGVRPGIRLHAGAEDYHFPGKTFLRDGYAPPGGYVKDFGVVFVDRRLHLFHIDGRPGEVCWVTGNEISFGHASTANGCHWLRHRMPLAVGDRPWESEHVWTRWPQGPIRSAVGRDPFVFDQDGQTVMSAKFGWIV